MLHRPTGITEQLALDQGDPFQMGKQTLVFGARQGGKNVIGDRR
jgi:hypothetical protein